MSSSVDVTLNGIDNLSGVLARASAAGTAMGNVLTAAMSTVGNVVGGALTKVNSLVGEAMNVQNSMIATAGSTQALLGGSFKEATEYAEKLSIAFTEMGAKLPGTTQDYKDIGATISDDVGGAFKDLTGALDKPAFEKALLEMTQGVGILAQTAGTAAGEAAFAIARVVNGDKNAFKLLFFDKNPVIKNQVEKFLEAEGKTLEGWTEMTSKERILILNKALGKAASPEMVAALGKTASGKLAEWETALFDSSTGLIGFLRKVETRGGQTALDALYTLMDKTQIAFESMAARFPFKFDVMEAIIDGMTAVGALMDGVGGFFKGNNLGAIGTRITAELTKVFSAVQSLDFQAIGGNVATGLQDILSKAGNALKALLSGLDIKGAFIGITDVASKLTQGIGHMTSTMAANLGDGINVSTAAIIRAAKGANWTEIGTRASGAFANAISAVIKTVVTLIASTNWQQVFEAVKALAEGLQQALRAAIVNLGSAMVTAVASGIGQIVSAVSGYLQQAFASAVSAIGGAAAPAVPTPTATPTATPATTGTATPPATTPPAASPTANANTDAETAALQAAAAGRSAATGNLQPLFAAVTDEQRNSGGKALIANTNETILNPKQTGAISKLIGGFSPTINITAGQNANDIAQAVTSALDTLYRQYQMVL
jgi:uncharacterized protein YqgV (UPF0045/DUF77 family)